MTIKTQAYLQGYLSEKTAAQPQLRLGRPSGVPATGVGEVVPPKARYLKSDKTPLKPPESVSPERMTRSEEQEAAARWAKDLESGDPASPTHDLFGRRVNVPKDLYADNLVEGKDFETLDGGRRIPIQRVGRWYNQDASPGAVRILRRDTRIKNRDWTWQDEFRHGGFREEPSGDDLQAMRATREEWEEFKQLPWWGHENRGLNPGAYYTSGLPPRIHIGEAIYDYANRKGAPYEGSAEYVDPEFPGGPGPSIPARPVPGPVPDPSQKDVTFMRNNDPSSSIQARRKLRAAARQRVQWEDEWEDEREEAWPQGYILNPSITPEQRSRNFRAEFDPEELDYLYKTRGDMADQLAFLQSTPYKDLSEEERVDLAGLTRVARVFFEPGGVFYKWNDPRRDRQTTGRGKIPGDWIDQREGRVF